MPEAGALRIARESTRSILERRSFGLVFGVLAAVAVVLAQQGRIDVTLKVGTAADSVTINADAALVTVGIHRDDLGTHDGGPPEPARLAALLARSPVRPDVVLPRFVW